VKSVSKLSGNSRAVRGITCDTRSHYILPVGEIAQQLVHCGSPAYVRPDGCTSHTQDMTRALEAIVGRIRKQAGFDLTGYKPTLVLWSVKKRMDARRVRSFEVERHCKLRTTVALRDCSFRS
jgi:two-component system, chemotaxis family, CheB/CheR fusion protein